MSLYLKLPGDAEAAFIHREVPAGAPILELGCGAGRVTRHLVALGHEVTGVDHSQEMLDEMKKIPGTERVLSDLGVLDLTPRRWPVVLLASHLINEFRGPDFLAAAARHVASDGRILIQRWEPGKVDSLRESRSDRPGLIIEMQNIRHPEPGVLSATMVYDIDGERLTQDFTAYEVDDGRLDALAAAVGCEVEAVLGKHRTWIRLRRGQPHWVEGGEEVLRGGVANAGAVVRAGSDVLRPSNEHSDAILNFLSQLEAVGFTGAPSPIRLDPDGRERLRFIPGDVAIPPYPEWSQSDEALASVTVLVRELHDASEHIDTRAMRWSAEVADPYGGPVMCHNDVCLENVVFRDGRAIALLDFDFAAPGRRTFDLATFARMCVPVDDDISAGNLGWLPSDRPGRLRLVCDTYGLDAEGRSEVLSALNDSIARGGEFVRRRAEAGEPGFVQMWAEIGGMERFDRRRRWWAEAEPRFEAALR